MDASGANAPGAAAKAYASRINRLLGWSRSPAALLVHSQPAELVVHIDASHDHSTLGSLAIPRGIDVLSLHRPTARHPVLDASSHAVRVSLGDELTLRGLPHALASVAVAR